MVIIIFVLFWSHAHSDSDIELNPWSISDYSTDQAVCRWRSLAYPVVPSSLPVCWWRGHTDRRSRWGQGPEWTGHPMAREREVSYTTNTVEPALKDQPIGHNNMVSQYRWSLVTGSVALKCGTFSAKSIRSFKTCGLSCQWSLQTGFTDSQLAIFGLSNPLSKTANVE